MAYLDKDGIPQVAGDIQRYNDRINETVQRLGDIQLQLTDALNQMPGDRWKDDAELAENLHCCHVLLEKSKERCQAYYMFG